jgi:hypothetical protein
MSTFLPGIITKTFKAGGHPIGGEILTASAGVTLKLMGIEEN